MQGEQLVPLPMKSEHTSPDNSNALTGGMLYQDFPKHHGGMAEAGH